MSTVTPESFSAISLVNKSAVEIINALADAVMANQIDLISTAYYNSNTYISVIRAEWIDLPTNEHSTFKIIKWKEKGPLTDIQKNAVIAVLCGQGFSREEALDFVRSKPPVNKETENGHV